MSLKLVATDMDGTFLRGEKTFDKALAKEVFKGLKEKGIRFAITSGNMVPKLESYFDDEIKDYVYFVGDDGNVLKKW